MIDMAFGTLDTSSMILQFEFLASLSPVTLICTRLDVHLHIQVLLCPMDRLNVVSF